MHMSLPPTGKYISQAGAPLVADHIAPCRIWMGSFVFELYPVVGCPRRADQLVERYSGNAQHYWKVWSPRRKHDYSCQWNHVVHIDLVLTLDTEWPCQLRRLQLDRHGQYCGLIGGAIRLTAILLSGRKHSHAGLLPSMAPSPTGTASASQSSKRTYPMQANVCSHTLRYLMYTLGWNVSWTDGANFLGLANQIPSMQDISSGLANVTAALFWLSAHDSVTNTNKPLDERLWPVGYTISVSEPVILNHLNVHLIPHTLPLSPLTSTTDQHGASDRRPRALYTYGRAGRRALPEQRASGHRHPRRRDPANGLALRALPRGADGPRRRRHPSRAGPPARRRRDHVEGRGGWVGQRGSVVQ
jgi:hypothetical protein